MFKTEQEKCDHFNSRFIVGNPHDRGRIKQKSPAFLDEDGQAIALFEEDWDDDGDGNIFVSLLLNIDPQYKTPCPTRIDYLELFLRQFLAFHEQVETYWNHCRDGALVDDHFYALCHEAKRLQKEKRHVDA